MRTGKIESILERCVAESIEGAAYPEALYQTSLLSYGNQAKRRTSKRLIFL
jgi:hypothetical protein